MCRGDGGELNQYFIIILSYGLRKGNLKMRKDKGRILVLMTMPNEVGVFFLNFIYINCELDKIYYICKTH